MKTVYLILGWYFHRKVQRRVQAVGAYAAARQLRKQGVDVKAARLLVAYQPFPVLRHAVRVFKYHFFMRL